MLALFAKVTVKKEMIERFLTFLRADLEGTLREPGCLRFDVSRDQNSPEVFYLYEVYRDAAAYEVHKDAPYFKAFFAEAGDTLAGPPEGFFGTTILPDDAAYWLKR